MIYTAHDVVDYLLTATNGGGQDGEHRAIRQAVASGYREVMFAKDWLWHTTTGSFTTGKLQTTATWTSGSNQITVASSTGLLVGRRVSGVGIDQDSRIHGISGNVITLTNNTTAAGTNTAVQFETFYMLPENVRDIDSLLTRTTGIINVYLNPVEWKQMDTVVVGNGDPLFYTVMRSDDPAYPDRYMVRFLGVPTDGLEVTFSYRFQPKPLKYMGFEQPARSGTVSVSGTAVTGTNTQFPTDAAGCILRLGTASNAPEPIGGLFPYAAQQKIAARSSTQALTLDASPGAYSSVKYVITDVIECSSTMYTAVLAAAEMWYARLTGKPAQQVMSTYMRDIRIAMEQDAVNPLSGQRNSVFTKYPTPRSMGYYSPQLPDQG